MAQNKTINIELVYIKPDSQNIIKLELHEGSDIQTAITESRLLKHHPEIDLKVNKVGVFNEIQELNTVLREGDRVEIYRPLRIDPKQARLRRAEKK